MNRGARGAGRAIIIVGGYNSLWPGYLGMARDLEDLTGLRAVAVPYVPWDWWRASRATNGTNLLMKLRDTVAWARHRLGASQFVLVGHSAGGLIGRLYLSEAPVWGTTYVGVEHVSTLITLGTPHCCQRGVKAGWFLSNVANGQVPGAFYADRVRYRAVAGNLMQGSEQGTHKQRRAHRAYCFFCDQGNTWGDGIVPVSCARLEGAQNVELEGVAHSLKIGSNWYGGSAAVMARWWPAEVMIGV